jgi:hypothetical protein
MILKRTLKDVKNKKYITARKIIELFVLWGIQGVGRHIHFGFPFISMCVKAIAGTDKKCNNTKNLQIEKEYRGVYPAISKVF